jgi:hypothetical protein
VRLRGKERISTESGEGREYQPNASELNGTIVPIPVFLPDKGNLGTKMEQQNNRTVKEKMEKNNNSWRTASNILTSFVRGLIISFSWRIVQFLSFPRSRL